MACFQKSGSTERDNEQAIAILKKGAYLLKYGRRGKPKFFPFRLSTDETALLWYCGKKEKRLKLSLVSRIVPGQRTAVFRRYPQPEKEYQSFSLIYGDRSLDLVCKDKDEAEFWITTLRELLSHGKCPQPINHSRSLGFFTDGARPSRDSVSNFSSASSETSYKEQGVTERAYVSCKSTPPRLAKAFSDVFMQTGVLKTLSLEEPVQNPLNTLPENLDNRQSNSSAVDSCKYSVCSAVSSSSQGSSSEDSLCDVFVWGECFGNGLTGGGGMRRAGSSCGLLNDLFLPKVLKSHVALDAQTIACGTKYGVLVTKHGQIYSWGEESGGKLGHGISSDIHQPRLIDHFDGTQIEFADCGEFHTCAVTVSGDLYAWGDGTHNLGLLGLGNEVSHWKPVRILGQLEGIIVKNISCGSWHTAFVTSEGKLFTFGDGSFGALGHGDRTSANKPREVQVLRGFRTVRLACGVWHTAAVVEITSQTSASGSSLSGNLFTWGDGEKGKLGHGDEGPRLVPSRVVSLETTSFRQVACGQSITVALSVSGRVYAMGTADPSCKNTGGLSPVCIEDGIGKSFVEDVACGFHHVAVLTSKSEVYTWGRGSSGQLGHGDTEHRSKPSAVSALKGKQVKRVVCGSNFTAAICLHKPISSKESSRCSSCMNPFNYLRKPHNCYNCGSVFCNTCTNNKSFAAGMAPKINKPFRVCNDCYEKLEGFRESDGFHGNIRCSSASLPSSSNNDTDEKEVFTAKTQRQLLRLDSFDFFRQVKSPELKMSSSETDIKGVSNPKGIRRLSRLTSFDSFKQRGLGQHWHRQRSKHFASKSDTSSVIRHSVAGTVPLSQRTSAELFPMSLKSSPVYSTAATSDYFDVPDQELAQYGSKKSNHCLNQEIAVLKAQVEDLTQKTKQLEAQLGTTSKKLEVAVMMAREEAEQNTSSKEVIRSLTMKLLDSVKKERNDPRRPHRRGNSF